MRAFIQALETDTERFRTLSGYLGSQQQAILDRDVPEMERVNPLIEDLTTVLSKSAEKRTKVMKKYGAQATTKGVEKLFSKVQPALKNRILQQWEELVELHQECCSTNERNGRLLSLQQQAINKILVADNANSRAGYNADGYDTSGSSSLSLARA